MKTYQIALPDEFAAFVDRVLAAGTWPDADHLVMYALWAVMDELRRDEDVDKEALRKAIQIGIDQADRGETKELDMAAVWARAMSRLKEREEVSHAGRDAEPAG